MVQERGFVETRIIWSILLYKTYYKITDQIRSIDFSTSHFKSIFLTIDKSYMILR